ncbi:MAG: alpha/beta hydrolase [Anaerolineaceae bacterium]|nr:alpha/beta hydrolase [Anaerolineaceae bacterium]
MQSSKRFDPDTHYAMPGEPPRANTEHIKRRCLDVPYGSLSESQKLDIYLPDNENGPFPVILAIHGGAFMGCDKADIQVLPMLEALKRNYAVVSINYRLSWEAIFPALIHDAKTTVRWVRSKAEEFQFDPQRIAVWGGSAGGYLSLMLGVTQGLPEFEDLSLGYADQPSDVQAIVAWFPPTNFLKMDEQLEACEFLPAIEYRHSEENSPESLILGNQITKIPELVEKANPETYIRAGLAPFFIQHGTSDDTVPYQQSLGFAKKLAAISPQTVTHELLPNARHADAAFETPQNIQKVLDFLDKALSS